MEIELKNKEAAALEVWRLAAAKLDYVRSNCADVVRIYGADSFNGKDYAAMLADCEQAAEKAWGELARARGAVYNAHCEALDKQLANRNPNAPLFNCY